MQKPSQWDAGAWRGEGQDSEVTRGCWAGARQWAVVAELAGEETEWAEGRLGLSASQPLRLSAQQSRGQRVKGCSRGRSPLTDVAVTSFSGSESSMCLRPGTWPHPSERTRWRREAMGAAQGRREGAPPRTHSLEAAPPLAGHAPRSSASEGPQSRLENKR